MDDPQFYTKEQHEASEPTAIEETHGKAKVLGCEKCESMDHSCLAHCLCVYCVLRKAGARADIAESRVAVLEAKLEVAEKLIENGVEIMSPSQVGQWAGVRAWQESPLEAYSKSASAAAQDGGGTG